MKCDRLVKLGRREFLTRGAVTIASTAATTAGTLTSASAGQVRGKFPSTRLANTKQLNSNEPLEIDYPDSASPGVLIKFDERVPGGAGPDSNIVAYSVLCPHKGYPLLYAPDDKTFNCPGHYSRFDAELEGQQIFGMSNQSLPKFLLRVEANGDIFAEGVDELIYGRTNNLLES